MKQMEICLFVILGFRLLNSVGAACGSFPNHEVYGEFSYQFNAADNCTWTISEANMRDDVILVIRFMFIRGYSNKDTIYLPEGEILPRTEVQSGKAVVCRKYVTSSHRSEHCQNMFAESYCPEPSKVATWPIQIGVRTEDDLNNYLYFKFAYAFLPCLTLPTTITPLTPNVTREMSGSASTDRTDTSLPSEETKSSDNTILVTAMSILGICLILSISIIAILVWKTKKLMSELKTVEPSSSEIRGSSPPLPLPNHEFAAAILPYENPYEELFINKPNEVNETETNVNTISPYSLANEVEKQMVPNVLYHTSTENPGPMPHSDDSSTVQSS